MMRICIRDLRDVFLYQGYFIDETVASASLPALTAAAEVLQDEEYQAYRGNRPTAIGNTWPGYVSDMRRSRKTWAFGLERCSGARDRRAASMAWAEGVQK